MRGIHGDCAEAVEDAGSLFRLDSVKHSRVLHRWCLSTNETKDCAPGALAEVAGKEPCARDEVEALGLAQIETEVHDVACFFRDGCGRPVAARIHALQEPLPSAKEGVIPLCWMKCDECAVLLWFLRAPEDP